MCFPFFIPEIKLYIRLLYTNRKKLGFWGSKNYCNWTFVPDIIWYLGQMRIAMTSYKEKIEEKISDFESNKVFIVNDFYKLHLMVWKGKQ